MTQLVAVLQAVIRRCYLALRSLKCYSDSSIRSLLLLIRVMLALLVVNPVTFTATKMIQQSKLLQTNQEQSCQSGCKSKVSQSMLSRVLIVKAPNLMNEFRSQTFSTVFGFKGLNWNALFERLTLKLQLQHQPTHR